jgi:3-deoxy-D-manno-octulosonic-acid transferase
MIFAFFISFINKKIGKAFWNRIFVFKKLKKFRKIPGRRSLLIHASSMGEFEHIKPLIRKLKETYPHSSVIVTFFSPSGYENIKKFEGVDFFIYLPFDISFTMRKFYNKVRPDALIIAKYDIWPNMVWEASKLQIPIFIINASLSKESGRFKGISGFLHREIYKNITELWVSSEKDLERFNKLAKNVRISVTGDTKFDQVLWRKENAVRSEILDEKILVGKKVFIAGSIWPQDWNVLLPVFDKLMTKHDDLFVILVPHEPTEDHILELKEKITFPNIRFSRLGEYKNERYIIVNRIGVLASMYSKADFAYVGGSFKQNIHNVLEPAVFGIPVFYGPVHKNSFEAVELNQEGGSIVIENSDEFYERFDNILSSKEEYEKFCDISAHYTGKNKGATERVIYRLKEYLS